MESTLLEKSKGATYMSFLLDVEIIIKKGGVRADLAESKIKNTTQGKKSDDKDSKSNKQQNKGKTNKDKQGGVNVYAAEMDQSDIFQRLAGEKQYEIASSLKNEIKTDTNLDTISQVQDYKTDEVSKKDSTTVRKKIKTDRTAKAFKGKVEPIDFWECNRIFLCNRLQIENQNMQIKKFYSKKKNVQRFSKTISNIKVLNSQNNHASHLYSSKSLDTLNKMNQISLPRHHEQFKAMRRCSSLENTSGVSYRHDLNSNGSPPLKPPLILIESNLERNIKSQMKSVSCHQFHSYCKKFNKATKLQFINTGSERKRSKYFTRFTINTKTSSQRHSKYYENKEGKILTKHVKSWPLMSVSDCNSLRRSGSCPLIKISSSSHLVNDKTKEKLQHDPCLKNNSIKNKLSIENDLSETLSSTTPDEMKSLKQNKKDWRHNFKNVFPCMSPKY